MTVPQTRITLAFPMTETHLTLRKDFVKALALAATLLSQCLTTYGATVFWEAFNDHRPTDGVTSPNASGYDMRITDDGGVLRNITTGADLPVSFIVVVEGEGTPDDFGANSPREPRQPGRPAVPGQSRYRQ